MIVDYINLIIFYIQHLNQFQSEYQQSHFHSKSVFIIRLIHWIRFSLLLYLTGRWYEVLFLLQPWLQDGIALAFRQFNTTGTAISKYQLRIHLFKHHGYRIHISWMNIGCITPSNHLILQFQTFIIFWMFQSHLIGCITTSSMTLSVSHSWIESNTTLILDYIDFFLHQSY